MVSSRFQVISETATSLHTPSTSSSTASASTPTSTQHAPSTSTSSDIVTPRNAGNQLVPVPSTSKRKLDLFSTPETADEPLSGDSYAIIHSLVLQSLVKSLACPSCHGSELDISDSSRHGPSSKLTVTCTVCEEVLFDGFSAPRVSKGRSFDVNNRFVLGCKSAGVGYERAKTVCLYELACTNH